MKTVTLRLEDSDKKELDAICEEMGMNITTLFNIYAKVVLRERRIPFEVAAVDDFYSDANQEQLRKSIEQG